MAQAADEVVLERRQGWARSAAGDLAGPDIETGADPSDTSAARWGHAIGVLGDKMRSSGTYVVREGKQLVPGLPETFTLRTRCGRQHGHKDGPQNASYGTW